MGQLAVTGKQVGFIALAGVVTAPDQRVEQAGKKARELNRRLHGCEADTFGILAGDRVVIAVLPVAENNIAPAIHPGGV